MDTVREELALRFAIFERGLLLKALDVLAHLPAGPSIVPPAMVVPELQKRGLFRTEYTGKTLRDHLGLPRPESRYKAVSKAAE
jgi:hypothetical protein